MQVATATGGGGRAPRGPLHPTSRPRLRHPPPCRGAVAKAVFCYCYVAWVSTLRFFENRKPTKPNKTRHRVSRPSSQSNQRQRQAQVEVEVRRGQDLSGLSHFHSSTPHTVRPSNKKPSNHHHYQAEAVYNLTC